MRKLIFLFLFVPLASAAQKKLITLEDLYKLETFSADPARASFDSSDISDKVKGADVKKENGKPVGTLQTIVPARNNPNRFIIRTDAEPIYRRSSKAYVYVYDLSTRKTIQVDKEKIMHPTFSPDGSRVAFVKNNNLYIMDIASNSVKAITTDGKWNFIINGNCDWVYEEEFGFSQAYQWSPSGNYIAYYRFDETNVKEYNMTIYDDKYNKDYRYKYPKPGEDNSIVEIYI